MTEYWVVLGAAAVLVGFAKTAIGGFGTVAVALGAAVMPARESTAAMLLILLVGDVMAVVRYRRHADWPLIRTLLPSVLPGILIGTAVLTVINDTTLKRLIGVTIVVLVAVQLMQRRRPSLAALEHRGAGLVVGVVAGFTTMTANAAGPVMTLFLVSKKVDKLRFIGTGAWFFLVVNASKLPFSASLGLFDEHMFRDTALLVPLVILGAWLGVLLVTRIEQEVFEVTVLLGSSISAVALFLA